MKINDLISMAIKNLTSRKLRTFLTILGVIIGCASIVVMVSLGYGMTKADEEWIASMGNIREIKIHGKTNDKTGKTEVLTEKHISQFRKIPHVENVFGILTLNGENLHFNIRAKSRYDGYGDIIGIAPENMEAFGLKLADGSFPNKSNEMMAVYGSQIKNNFWNYSGNNSRQINIDLKTTKLELHSTTMDPDTGESKDKSIPLKYSGELAESQNWEVTSAVFLPIDAVRKLLIEENEKKPTNERDKNIKDKFSRIVIVIDNLDHVKDIKKDLTDQGYQAEAMTDWLDSTKKQSNIIQAVFGGIGAVSLLVAAIGISNTMVMSIQERTKEIGIMKVIGASIKDIQTLFLFEAACIGFLGGIIGLAISFLISTLLNKFLGPAMMGMTMSGEPAKISIITFGLVISAILFTTLIGVISGYFPARRAMKISALDAMRYE